MGCGSSQPAAAPALAEPRPAAPGAPAAAAAASARSPPSRTPSRSPPPLDVASPNGSKSRRKSAETNVRARKPSAEELDTLSIRMRSSSKAAESMVFDQGYVPKTVEDFLDLIAMIEYLPVFTDAGIVGIMVVADMDQRSITELLSQAVAGEKAKPGHVKKLIKNIALLNLALSDALSAEEVERVALNTADEI